MKYCTISQNVIFTDTIWLKSETQCSEYYSFHWCTEERLGHHISSQIHPLCRLHAGSSAASPNIAYCTYSRHICALLAAGQVQFWHQDVITTANHQTCFVQERICPFVLKTAYFVRESDTLSLSWLWPLGGGNKKKAKSLADLGQKLRLRTNICYHSKVNERKGYP